MSHLEQLDSMPLGTRISRFENVLFHRQQGKAKQRGSRQNAHCENAEERVPV
jgi:hypothetical protein